MRSILSNNSEKYNKAQFVLIGSEASIIYKYDSEISMIFFGNLYFIVN